jgi:glutaredoxin
MITFTKVDGRNVAEIKMLALSTCPWCHKTKDFFKHHNIEYSYIDVDLLSGKEEEEVEREYSQYMDSFPTIFINNDRVITGYDEGALEALANM